MNTISAYRVVASESSGKDASPRCLFGDYRAAHQWAQLFFLEPDAGSVRIEGPDGRHIRTFHAFVPEARRCEEES